MATYIDLDGVRTWYDESGVGEPLVLLHPGGGGVDSRALGPNLDAMTKRFRTFTPERTRTRPDPGYRRSDHLRKHGPRHGPIRRADCRWSNEAYGCE